MTIDWTDFTPLASLLGGVAIGLAASGLILFNGRIAGISGITGGLFQAARGDVAWRLAFLAGLILAPAVYRLLAPLPSRRIDAGWATLAIAGLLVGLGTRYAKGCTSGHGICGLGNLSPRSLVAVCVFMASALATVFVVHHLGGA